jgi:hypothetical protein
MYIPTVTSNVLSKQMHLNHRFSTRVQENLFRVSANYLGKLKNFKVPRKIPYISRNMAVIFVWQLAILETFPCATKCLLAYKYFHK